MLQKALAQIFVDRKIPLLLLSKASLYRGLLDDLIISVKRRQAGHGPIARHREYLTVAALKAAAIGRPRASLYMVIKGYERGSL